MPRGICCGAGCCGDTDCNSRPVVRPGFGVEQVPFSVQTQSYPKGSLLDGTCPSSVAPGVLSSEQDFQAFPKSQLGTVSVNYCPVGQDFPGSNLNLLSGSSGKTTASLAKRRWVEPHSDSDVAS